MELPVLECCKAIALMSPSRGNLSVNGIFRQLWLVSELPAIGKLTAADY